jgi:hypothetical protein
LIVPDIAMLLHFTDFSDIHFDLNSIYDAIYGQFTRCFGVWQLQEDESTNSTRKVTVSLLQSERVVPWSIQGPERHVRCRNGLVNDMPLVYNRTSCGA